MKRKLLLILTLLLSLTFVSFAQEVGNIKGKVVTRSGRHPIAGAKVVLEGADPVTVYTNSEGLFSIENVAYGTQKITIDATDYQESEVNVKVDLPVRDLNFITLSPAFTINEFDDSSFTEFDTEVEGDDQSPSISLSSSRDPFVNVSGYKFGALRFRARGYESSFENVSLNGVKFNDALSGYSPWSLWSGLNEAVRNKESVLQTNVSGVGIGGIGSSTDILARASQMRQGFRASVVNASALYRLRVMLTYTSGMRDDGWAYAFSLSTRQGGNSYVEGINYNAWAYFLSAEKKFNDQHQLGFTFFGVPTERGVAMGATEENYELTKDYFYNPNMGLQNGELRNARVKTYHEPVAMLNYYYTPSDRTKVDVAASFRFGDNGYSALDWSGAADPKPDYHQNLPDYYESRGETALAIGMAEEWKTNYDFRYIDFDNLYNVNYNSKEQEKDRYGNLIETGKRRSRYIISERHTDQRDFRFKTQIEHTINNSSKFLAGVEYRRNRSEYYTSIKDLLGGDYWLNVDNFAERDFPNLEMTLNDISRDDNYIIKEGDKYGYDYFANVGEAKLWGIYNFRTGQFQFDIAGDVNYTYFWREGVYQKGLFPNDSQGKSETQKFFGYTAKINAKYSPTAAQSIMLSAVAQQNAPFFKDAFVSPRTRNEVASNLTTEKILSTDFTYSLSLSAIKLRASVYYTTIKDQTKLISFYDDIARAFTNFSMSDINQRHMGIELGFEVPIFIQDLKLSGAVSWGDYIYTSNPLFTQTVDNVATARLTDETVWWKDSKVESTPQLATNISLNYRTGSNWFFGIDFNFFDHMYLSMNPLYRTEDALIGRINPTEFANVEAHYGREFLTPALIAKNAGLMGTVTDDQGRDVEINLASQMMDQERFKPVFLMNLSVGKNWYIKSSQLGVNLEIKNLTNTLARTGGFEQMRPRRYTDDRNAITHYERFDPKYFYMYGISYYINIHFRF